MKASHIVPHGKGHEMLTMFCEQTFPTIMAGVNKRASEIGFARLGDAEWPSDGVVQ